MGLTVDSIKAVLADTVQGRLAQHGGGVEVCGLSEQGEVRVAFTGHCSTCPAQEATLRNLVTDALHKAFPQEPLRVIAINRVNDDLWNMAKNILRKNSH